MIFNNRELDFSQFIDTFANAVENSNTIDQAFERLQQKAVDQAYADIVEAIIKNHSGKMGWYHAFILAGAELDMISISGMAGCVHRYDTKKDKAAMLELLNDYRDRDRVLTGLIESCEYVSRKSAIYVMRQAAIIFTGISLLLLVAWGPDILAVPGMTMKLFAGICLGFQGGAYLIGAPLVYYVVWEKAKKEHLFFLTRQVQKIGPAMTRKPKID